MALQYPQELKDKMLLAMEDAVPREIEVTFYLRTTRRRVLGEARIKLRPEFLGSRVLLKADPFYIPITQSGWVRSWRVLKFPSREALAQGLVEPGTFNTTNFTQGMMVLMSDFRVELSL